ncbi:CsbD family protein [Nannocystaceae bacterium ST9]
MPNQDQVKGQWEQLKGRVKHAWGELTDDDFLKAEGSSEKLYGIIQERFGDTKEAIKKKLDAVSMR